MPGAAILTAAPDQGSLSLFGRNRVHGPALALAREHEALVALLRDLRALSAVSADALRPEIGQESTRLAFYVGAHVPGIGAGHQGRIHDLGDVGAPFVLRLRARLNRCKLVPSHVGDAFGDPLDMLLYRDRHVRQHRGALRAGDREQVGVAGDRQAEIGLRAVLPHSCASALPSRPLMARFFSGPVIASKPVAMTMMSSGYSLPPARMPFGVISSIGPSVLASTSATFFLLKVSK